MLLSLFSWHNNNHARNKASTADPAALGETSKGNIMFYAVRTQQVTDTLTERQLLKFYNKAERASYLETRGDAEPISAREAYKFSLSATGRTVRSPEAGIIFFVHTIY